MLFNSPFSLIVLGACCCLSISSRLMSLYIWTLFALGAVEVACLTLNPSQFSTLARNISLVDPPTRIFNQSASRLSKGLYRCDKEIFGQPHPASCRDAYEQMDTGDNVATYGDRDTPGTFNYLLPLRYTSCTL